MGPTPPGTGLSASTRPSAPFATSPTSFPSSVTLVPTSTTHAWDGSISGSTMPATPAAAITRSEPASTSLSCSEEVLVWHTVTVACLCMSISAAALPTFGLLPITAHLLCSKELLPYHSSSEIAAHAVQGRGIAVSPRYNLPRFSGWTPSTSFPDGRPFSISSTGQPFGNGVCSIIPSTS